jgi:glycosyltransferase involved in cell wall biosynthesis
MMRNALQLIGSFAEGGSERQAIQLARLMKERGRYNVHVACLDGSGVLRDEVERMGFTDIPQFPLTSFYDRNAVMQLNRFARFLREREVEIVQTHDFYTNVFGMAAASLARMPVRIASRRETTGWRSSAQKFVERRAYSLAHAIVANCNAARDQLISEGVSKKKISTIYNSLDFERVTPRAPMQRHDAISLFGLPGDLNAHVVTIVANLRHPVKNHPMFLRAASRVRDALPQARFVIAGEGELMNPMRAMAEQLGLSKSVFFIGRCDRIGDLLDLSDVCVLASTAEGFSNAILEYMAAARPVVATDVGGAREAIAEGTTGYLVPSDNDSAMAERIVALLRDPVEARAMGERGRQVTRQKFSCEAQLERTQELYDRMLARVSTRLRQPLDATDVVT